MVNCHSPSLAICLDDGPDLQVDLAGQKISTCSQLKKYVRSVCGHKVLAVKGLPLQLWEGDVTLGAISGHLFSESEKDALANDCKTVRIYAAKDCVANRIAWKLFVGASGQPTAIRPKRLEAGDSVLPYACFPSLTLKYQAYNAMREEKQLFVKRLPGESWPGPYGEVLSLAINLDATVSCLMAMLEDASGIPADQMRLVISGARRQLERDCKLSDYNIHKESTIHMVLRLRGGMLHGTSGRDGFKPISDNAIDAHDQNDPVQAEANVPTLGVPVEILLPSGGKLSFPISPETLPNRIVSIIAAIDTA